VIGDIDDEKVFEEEVVKADFVTRTENHNL